MEIIKDVDLFDHVNEYDVVLIGTNTYCTMSHGLQLKVMLNYHYVFEKNLSTKYADPDKLGTILECRSEGEPTFCLCFITEGYNFRPDLKKDYLSYEALEKCLSLCSITYKNARVACPLLGSSRFDGNGDRNAIFDIFERCTRNMDLTVYDYYQQTRGEGLKEIRLKELEVKNRSREEYYKMVAERKRIADERFMKNGHRRY